MFPACGHDFAHFINRDQITCQGCRAKDKPRFLSRVLFMTTRILEIKGMKLNFEINQIQMHLLPFLKIPHHNMKWHMIAFKF